MKPRIFSPVARQHALTWQAVCTQTVVRRLKCNHPSMKWIRSPRTALWHILAVYIMCPWDFYFSPIFPRIRSRHRQLVLNKYPNSGIYRPFLKYAIIKCRFRGLVARKPSLPWQPVCAPLVGGSFSCQHSTMKLINVKT